MALVSQIAWAQDSFGSNPTSTGITTTGATLLVIATTSIAGNATFTDSKGNTYTPLTAIGPQDSRLGRLHYCQNPTVGASHTFTIGTNPNFGGSVVAAFDSTLTSGVFDQQNSVAFGAGLTKAVGSITPGSANNLLIAAVVGDPATSESINAGYTIAGGTRYVGSTHEGVFLAYLIQTAATAQNPTWTVGSNGDVIGGLAASFNMTGGGGGGGGVMAPGLSVRQAVRRSTYY